MCCKKGMRGEEQRGEERSRGEERRRGEEQRGGEEKRRGQEDESRALQGGLGWLGWAGCAELGLGHENPQQNGVFLGFGGWHTGRRWHFHWSVARFE